MRICNICKKKLDESKGIAYVNLNSEIFGSGSIGTGRQLSFDLCFDCYEDIRKDIEKRIVNKGYYDDQ